MISFMGSSPEYPKYSQEYLDTPNTPLHMRGLEVVLMVPGGFFGVSKRAAE